MVSEIKLEPDGNSTIVYWRNNLSLKIWPNSVAATIMLPKMKETATEDRRIFRKIIERRKNPPHPNFIDPRI